MSGITRDTLAVSCRETRKETHGKIHREAQEETHGETRRERERENHEAIVRRKSMRRGAHHQREREREREREKERENPSCTRTEHQLPSKKLDNIFDYLNRRKLSLVISACCASACKNSPAEEPSVVLTLYQRVSRRMPVFLSLSGRMCRC